MTHSATMTIDARYRWSFTAWCLAAICAIFLAESAKTLVINLPAAELPVSQSIENNYSRIGNQGR